MNYETPAMTHYFDVSHPNLYYLIHTICMFQTHQLLYKIISWQHVSTVLSHRQALHRTDPKYMIHDLFGSVLCKA